MPANEITENGITVKTQQELIDEYVANYLDIYGVDLSALPPDNPDVQMMMVGHVQPTLDLQDMVVQVYNGMDPDKAIGKVLDRRVAINGIQRQGGTYSVTNVTIVVDRGLTLNGLNTASDNPYTVADNAGNKWFLAETQNPAAPGTYVYAFRAAEPGAVLTTPNTITVPVSVVLGVTTINNPTTYTTLGVNEEKDAVLRMRRVRSVMQKSQGYNAALKATLENINGIIAATIFENNSNAVDPSGTEGHTIWVIIEGTAPAADIANAIYTKRNAGPGMRGTEEYVITQLDGTQFPIRWQYVEQEDLYIKFTATSLNGEVLPNVAAILAQLPNIYKPKTNEEVNINQLGTLVQQIDPNTLITAVVPNEGFSLTGVAGTFGNTLNPSNRNKRFSVSAPNIDITVTPL